MKFSVNFQTRDFETAILAGLQAAPVRLAWSCFGGPSEALVKLTGQPNQLINAAGLLRAPVTVSDPDGVPVWFGFVNRVEIFQEGIKFSLAIDELFNKVKVSYSFLSPDQQVGEHLETAYAHDLASQAEYGIREKVLYYTNIDDLFAEAARDIFLEAHAWPFSKLGSPQKVREGYVLVYCQGWFKTLSWTSYQFQDGFYSNYGPGPGVFNAAVASNRRPAQRVTPGAACSVKYVYFLLSKNNAPTMNLTARIYDESGNVPNNVLATSATVAASTLPSSGFSWIKFTFTTAYALSASTKYWIGLNESAVHATNNVLVRTDETNNYSQDNHFARFWTGAAWTVIPNVSAPLSKVSLYFRVICLTDTGEQIGTIAADADQFFNHVWSISSGRKSCPYLYEPVNALQKIQGLMALGTSNDRMILADVSADRNLTFYEQPEPDTPTAYLTSSGKLYTDKGILLPAYRPPVGQYAILANTPTFTMPFDKNRVPTCFIANAVYYPKVNRLLVNR